MGKLIFWIILVFVVMFALRLYNTAKLRQRSQQQPNRGPQVVEEIVMERHRKMVVKNGCHHLVSEVLIPPKGMSS